MVIGLWRGQKLMLQHLICILCGLKTPDRNSFFLPKFDVFPRESFYVILFTFSPLSFINVLNCTNPSTEFSVLLPACGLVLSCCPQHTPKVTITLGGGTLCVTHERNINFHKISSIYIKGAVGK